jgi:2-polyprenyl-3-methyl-5-hydroxy-6-metoxy-1,4-benzoquinol methylase
MSASRPYFEIANPEIPKILRGLPRELRVLDVGCGSGVHGAELTRILGHHVVGVDLSESSIAKARTRLDEAYVADVTQPELYSFYRDRKFDVIVFSDILEHLYDPIEVLTRHFALLAPSGQVVISLPNVAIWNVRLALLTGRFEYTDTGTMDRTHIRFFTRHGVDRLLRSAQAEVQARRITPGILRPFVPWIKRIYGRSGATAGVGDSSSIMESGPYRAYMKWLYPIERAFCRAWPGLLAFQYVMLVQPVGVVPTVDVATADLNELSRELEKQNA